MKEVTKQKSLSNNDRKILGEKAELLKMNDKNIGVKEKG